MLMHGHAFAIAPLIIAVCASASGQTPLPWLSGQGPQKATAAETVAVSELPLARARLETTGGVWVGQPVPLVIEVIVPSWFAGAPTFPDLEVANAVTLSPEAAWNFVVQSGRQGFSGQARRYLVFPQAEGRYTVAPPRVEVSYALPDGKPSPPALLAVSSLAFEARMPEGAAGAKYFLTADGFRLGQSFSSKPGELRVGDSLDRSVTMSAQNTVGISLPPLGFDAPDGIRLYPGTPSVTETAERGHIAATRTEKVTYVAEKEGRYTLPAITILWWNPNTRVMHRASLPEVEMNVSAGAAEAAEVFASQSADERQAGAKTDYRTSVRLALRWSALVLVATALLLLVRRLLRVKGVSLAAWCARRRRLRADAEATWFRRFRRATRSHDPRSALRHLMLWLDRADTRAWAPTLSRFAVESGIAALPDSTAELNDLMFARRPSPAAAQQDRRWSGRRLRREVARARKLGMKRGLGGRP